MKAPIKKPNRAGSGSFDSDYVQVLILRLDELKRNFLQAKQRINAAGGGL